MCIFSATGHASHWMNVSEPFPYTSTKFDQSKSSMESKKPGLSETMFAGVSRVPSSVSNVSVSSFSDRTSRVARITELSQMIQSRLRGPMEELGKHLECERMNVFTFLFFFHAEHLFAIHTKLLKIHLVQNKRALGLGPLYFGPVGILTVL